MDLRSADVRGAASCGASQQAAKVQTAILLGLLLAVQFGAAVLNPLGANEPDAYAEQLFLAALGAALAWPPLLAVWAVFGPQRAAVRLPLTLWLAAAITLAGIYGLNRNLGRPGVEMLIFNAAWLFAFGVLLGPLWLIRVLRRWRLERPERSAPACQAAKSNSQFSLRAILGWTFAAALLLGAYRAVAPVARLELEPEMIEALLLEAGLIGFFVALGGLQVVALAWIMLADGRRVLLRIILSVLLVSGISGAGVVFQRLVNGLSVGEIASVVAGAMFNGLLSLGVVRTCGYQLRRSPKKAAAAEAAATAAAAAAISRVRFAFALPPLVAIAAGLVCTIPHRQEMWRRADIQTGWRRSNVQVSFDEDGNIVQADYDSQEPISDEICGRLTTLGELDALTVNASQFGDRQLALLSTLLRLRTLDLSGTAITDRGLEQLGRFPLLVSLNVSNTQISDAGLKYLRALPKLERLKLSLADVSDDGLTALEGLAELRSVDARLTAVTSAGAEKLRRANPRVSVEFGASDALLAGWQTKTRTVTATDPSGVQTMAVVRESIKVKRLHARGKAVTNGVAAGVTDAGLTTLGAVQTELEELDLRDSEVTDQGVWNLRTLKSLKRLDLRGAPVTEQGVQRLARVLPECEILR